MPRYNGALADNAVDLGQTGSNYRFKDLYLSGGLRGDTTFKNNAGTTEYARFDSSGNLLVGATSAVGISNGSTNEGINLSSTQCQIAVGTSSDVSLYLNRQTTDGTIAEFRKDGSAVGSIGTLFGDLYAATGNTGIRFVDANRSVSPYDSNASALVDAAVDLGYASARYKDLYLSGGVYLGGTGSANKLDDYEEGTWTPSWKGGSVDGTASGTFTGTYTKVGRLVYCSVNIQAANLTGATGALLLRDLPFTVSSTAAATGGGTAHLEGVTAAWINGTPQAGSHVQIMPEPNTVLANFRVGLSINWDSYLSAASTFTSGGGSTYGKISFTYQTN